jgi:hypothetical protein
VAAAAFDPVQYQHQDVTYSFPATGYDYVHGHAVCPAGTLAVSAGVASGSPTPSWVSSMVSDLNSAYVAAYGTAGAPVTVSVRCLPADQLAEQTIQTLNVRDHRSSFHVTSGKVMCPTGTVPFGGGGYVSEFNSPAATGLQMVGSMPRDGGWTFAGAGVLFENQSLKVWTHCLPKARLGQISTVTQTVRAADPRPGVQPAVVGGARCPSGYFAYAGGAYLHKVGSSAPAWLGFFNVNSMAADDRGWMAIAHVHQPGAQLTTIAKCTKVIN